MTQLTVRLDAVNEVLDLLGKARTPDLGANISQSATLVQQRLDAVVRELQNRTWWFNLDRDVPHPLTAFGWAHLYRDTYLPTDRRVVTTTRTSVGAGALLVAERDGRRIFNRDGKTFVWDSTPPNLLVDPFDLDSGNWTLTNITSAPVINVDPPGFSGTREIVHLLTETSDGGTLSQTVLSTALSDQTTYVLGGYFKLAGTANTAADLQVTGSAGLQALLSFNPTTSAALAVTGEGADGDLIQMEEPGGWFFAYLEFEWLTAHGNISFIVTPETGAAANGQLYATGLSLMQKGASGPNLDVIRCYPYEDLPHTARAYVVRRTASEMNDVFGGTLQRRRHLLRREWEAKALLQDSDGTQGPGRQTLHSRSVSRVTGSLRRRPSLDNLGTGRILFD